MNLAAFIPTLEQACAHIARGLAAGAYDDIADGRTMARRTMRRLETAITRARASAAASVSPTGETCRVCHQPSDPSDRPYQSDTLCWDCHRALYGSAVTTFPRPRGATR